MIINLSDLFQVMPSGPVSAGVEEQRAISEVARWLLRYARSVLPSRTVARRDISGVGACPRKLASAIALLVHHSAGRLWEAWVIDAVPDHFRHRALAVL